jgi:transposase
MLLPPSLDELITQGHPVRIVNEVLNKINIDALLKKYKGGGSSSFHPRMLLKVLVYSYINNNYSSRKIEAALKENIHYIPINRIGVKLSLGKMVLKTLLAAEKIYR